PPLFLHFLPELLPHLLTRNAPDQFGMRSRDVPALERLAAFRRQVADLQPRVDVALGLADPLGQDVGRIAVMLEQPLVPFGLLDRGEVRALQVLDHLDLDGLFVAHPADDRGDRLDAGDLRGAPSALACDQFEMAVYRPHQDRLQDAPLLDRIGQLVELGHVESLPWVGRRGLNLVKRNEIDLHGFSFSSLSFYYYYYKQIS